MPETPAPSPLPEPQWALYQRWRLHQDREARRDLIAALLPLAKSVARRYMHRGEPYDDLVQVASIGLINALDRFEPNRGAFSTYAVATIDGQLKLYFRDNCWAVHVERSSKDRLYEIGQAQEAVAQREGRPPEVAEVAQYLQLSETEVRTGLQAGAAYSAGSINAPLRGDEDSGASWLDTIPAQDDPLARVEERMAVSAAASQLAPRDREILYLRFFREWSQSRIAAHVGLSQMQVCRLLDQSVTRLRQLTQDGDSTPAVDGRPSASRATAARRARDLLDPRSATSET